MHAIFYLGGHSGQVQESFKLPINSNRYSPYTGNLYLENNFKLIFSFKLLFVCFYNFEFYI